MPKGVPSFLREATRLTSEGRLSEALALLQRGAGSGAAPASGASPVIDLDPPVEGSDGAWTAPANHRQAKPSRPARPRHAGLKTLFEGRSFAHPGNDLVRPKEPIVPAGARFEARSFSNDAGTRPYRLYVPRCYAGQALPLVVMLHGCKQCPEDFAIGTRMNDLAETFGLLVAYPGQVTSANPSRCWNWFNRADQQRDRGEPSLIAGITRRVMQDMAVEPSRVFVAGLSAGGAEAAILGSLYPDLYRGVGVHSGLAPGSATDLPSALAAMRQGGPATLPRSAAGCPTIVFHGDADATVTPVNGDQVMQHARPREPSEPVVTRGRSPGGLAYTRTSHADCDGRVRLEQWVLHGMGHAWSGGAPDGSYTDPRGVDASREMVRFFLQAAAPATASP